jgi:hypothetical protein
MDVRTYYHLCEQQNWDGGHVSAVIQVIRNLGVTIDHGCSKQLRGTILLALNAHGWSTPVRLTHGSGISVTAVNGDQALCLQTGNMSRFYADLLKIEYLFRRGKIRSAIYVLPTKHTGNLMGSNVASFERLVKELKLFSDIISARIIVVGIEIGKEVV